MGATFTRRVQAALLSLVILGSVYGCARAPRNPGNNTNPGTTGAAVGGGAAGSTAGPNTGGGTAANGAGNARNGVNGAALSSRSDLGQQVSDSVARLVGGGTARTGFMGLGRTNGGAGTTDGDAAGRRVAPDPATGAPPGGTGAARPVGVSTLIIGNLAFVGLDLTTLPNGGATTGAATTGGATAGGAAAGAGNMTRNGADGAGLLGGPAGGATGAGGPGTGLVGNMADGTGGTGGAGRAPVGTTRNAPGAVAGNAGAGGMGAGGTNPTGGVALESRIRSHILGAYPQVDEVYVTTDPAMVQRIARVTGEMQNGTSAAPRLSEIFAIANTMVGTTRDTGTTGANGTR